MAEQKTDREVMLEEEVASLRRVLRGIGVAATSAAGELAVQSKDGPPATFVERAV